jgi:hypothetical protein
VSEYEFSEVENRVVASLARTCGIAGVLTVLLGVVVVGIGVGVIVKFGLPAELAADALGVIAASTLFFLFGIWTIRASRRLRLVVTTRGNDVSHLLGGFRELRRVYRTQQWLLIICFCLFIVALIIGIVLFVRAHVHAH